MPYRKPKKINPGEMQFKGIVSLVAGGVLLFMPMPFFGYALRPFSLVLFVLGAVVLTLPSFTAFLHTRLKLESGIKNAATNSSSNPSRNKQQKSPFASSPSAKVATLKTMTPDNYFRQKKDVWSSKVFNDIEWRRFESVCEALFCQAGFSAKTQSHGADGGIDIWLYSKNIVGPAAIVQCKHWRTRPVGVKEVREFYGVMAANKLSRGTYATSSTFTSDAIGFAKANGINAMDGEKLLSQISKRTTDQQQSLLVVAYEGEYWKPTCASCGIKMFERSKDDKWFWGCANFPKCKNTIAKSSA